MIKINAAITGKQFKLLREDYLEPKFDELSEKLELKFDELERKMNKRFEQLEDLIKSKG